MVWLGEQGYGYLGIQPFVSCVVPRLFCMLVHTLLSGVRVGGRTTVERARGLWPQVREMCVLRFRRGMYSFYELRFRFGEVR